jgi:hypothetical protein
VYLVLVPRTFGGPVPQCVVKHVLGLLYYD